MTMTFRASALAAALALTSFATALHAQTQVRVNVPFAFQNGASVLPAGVYTLNQLNQGNLLLQGHNTSLHITAFVENGSAVPGKTKVVFKKYGDKYFLREVWQAGNSAHSVLALSVEEQKARKLAHDIQLASTSTTPLEVAGLDATR